MIDSFVYGFLEESEKIATTNGRAPAPPPHKEYIRPFTSDVGGLADRLIGGIRRSGGAFMEAHPWVTTGAVGATGGYLLAKHLMRKRQQEAAGYGG